jgi:adenylate cyclase
MAKDRLSRKIAVILHADVVGSTLLVQQNETLAHERILASFHRFSETIKTYGGIAREIRGDALVAEFNRASDAVTAALAFQAINEEFNSALDDDIQPQLRIGISMGEVVIADGTITGAGVVLAQRLEQLAGPGGIVVQGTVSETVPTRIPFDFESLGEQVLKGFDKPVRAFAARLRQGQELPAPEAAVAPRKAEPESLQAPDKPSIAVLPFNNMSNDPEQEYFSEGITGDIVTALGRVRQFFVIARNTMYSYKGRAVDVKVVASELGVRYLLEGSVQKAGSRVRVSAQLVEGATGKQIWAERYDRDLVDIFEVQDEITANVVGAIEPELTRAEWERAKTKETENLDAWDYVVRAIALMMEFSDEGSMEAIKLLEQAIALDSRYARPYGHKAWLAIWRALQGWDEMEMAIEVAAFNAGRGIQLDVNEPWSYIARAFIGISTRDSELSLSSSRKAIELSPNFAYGHSVHGLAIALSGRGADGLGEIELAMRLSPRDIWREVFELHYAFAQFQTANYEEAARFAERGSLPRPGHVFPQLLLIASYGHLGQIKKGQQVLQRLENNSPDLLLTSEDIVQVYVLDEDHGRLLDGLDKAGMLRN